MPQPFPAFALSPRHTLAVPRMVVEIGLYDETDTPELPRNVPLAHYLSDLAEFAAAQREAPTR